MLLYLKDLTAVILQSNLLRKVGSAESSVFFIGQQVIEGITVRDNISNLSHIIGGIVGGFLGYGLNVQTRFDKWRSS